MTDKSAKDTHDKTWAADTIRKHMPSREEMARNKYLRPIAHRFLSPELWRFTRRSVPRGVALGLFSAFIIPVGQIFLAAFMALPLRANVPLAALVTFVTNPFTIWFWIPVANRVGNLMIHIDADTANEAAKQLQSGGAQWAVDAGEMAGLTILGFVVLAVSTAIIGFVVSVGVWRIIVARRRAKRLKVLRARLDQRAQAN
jgi:uncharacterized protein (DUF2062 family)